jgi:cytochrome c-type biogenesis protein CcmH/NrfF
MTASQRQAKYTAKLTAQGKCVRCRNKAIEDRILCVECTKKQRIYARARTKSKPWVKGGRGRPPKYS